MVKDIRIGIIGLGTVGSGVLEILRNKQDKIAQEIGARLVVTVACDRDPAREAVAAAGGARSFTTDARAVVSHPDVDIVVELIGGLEPAFSFMREALENGKHVVTANKEVISQKGQELFDTAAKTKRDIFFEASVGGGIPILRPLKEVLVGNDFSVVAGIVNGTTNYILTAMQQEGLSFDEALAQAQEKGYAEPDPTADIEGDDAAAKIAILASIAFNSRVTKPMVYKEGISRLTSADMTYAAELGYGIKLIAYARQVDGEIITFVRPALVRKDHPLASVNGVYNAIFVEGDACGQLMFFGEGAGSLAAGSSVVGDLVQVARNILFGSTGSIGCTCFRDLRVRPIEEIEGRYYILLRAADRPGVLARTAGCFAEENVSIASVIQKESNGAEADIVFMTHWCPERNLRAALAKIAELDVVSSIVNILMVLED